jgi:DNA-binding NarL/FixJ family response regulator
LVALGFSNDEIAERLHLSKSTVEGHIADILKALDVPDRTSAAVAALRRGLID